MTLTKQQLEAMSWPLIKIKMYESSAYIACWAKDRDLQKLLNDNNFIIDYQAWTYKYINFRTMCDKFLDTTSDKHLMTILLNYAYSSNGGKLDDTVSILDAIKYIKANILTASLISKSIEKVFSNLDYINGKWEYKRLTFYGLTWSVFTSSPVGITPTIVNYSYITDINKNIANTSLTSKTDVFKVEICNWWTDFDNIKTTTLKDLIKNTTIEVYIENAINSKRHMSLSTDIEHLPGAVKAAIEELLD